MLINHKKPSLNQGISRSSPSPSPFSHAHSYRVHHHFAHLVLILSRQQIFPLQSITPQVTYNNNLHPKYTIYPFSDSPSNFAPTSTSDNIEKYYLFYYSTPTHRFQPSLPSYGLTLIQSLPLFLNLDAIQAARLQFFRNPWHLS